MANEDVNLDRDWSININVSGITAPTGVNPANMPKGHYKAKITDAYVNPEKNRGRVIFKLTITEGEYTGVIRTDGMSIPKSSDDKVRYYWRALAESAGYTPAQLDNGEVTLNMASFKGRDVFIHFTPKGPNGTGTEYEDIQYLSPSAWEQQAKAARQTATGSTGDLPAAGALGGGTLGGSNTVTTGDVLSKLGLGGAAN